METKSTELPVMVIVVPDVSPEDGEIAVTVGVAASVHSKSQEADVTQLDSNWSI